MLPGQNLTYDFTTDDVSLSEWRSVMGYISTDNYSLPDHELLVADGLVLMGSPDTATYLELATTTIILPGWKGDILETHQPFFNKNVTSNLKIMLKGMSDSEVMATKSTEVTYFDPGSANLIGAECTDPAGCFVQIILWSHDSIDVTPLNILKKVEVRANSPVTSLNFTEHDPSLWEYNYGSIESTVVRKENADGFFLRSIPGVASSFRWTSNRIVQHGWRGNISESHAPQNVYWAGNVRLALKGLSTGTTMAESSAESGGKPLRGVSLLNAECNDPLGCAIEIELTSGVGNEQLVVNELKSIRIEDIPGQDNYDVGVFYMPLWHNKGGPAYWSSEQTGHHWHTMDSYNQEMELQGLHSLVKKPLDIYGSATSPESYYNEEDAGVNKKHLTLMKKYGIDYVIYDSYFTYHKQNSNDTVYNARKWAPFWNEVVKNVSQFETTSIPFSIMWANDFISTVYNPKDRSLKSNPRGCRGFFEEGGGLDKLTEHWDSLISNPNYKLINGKPVIYLLVFGTKDASMGGYTNSLEGLCGYCTDDPFFNELGQGRYEPVLHAKKMKLLLTKIEEKLDRDIYFNAVVGASTMWQDNGEKERWFLDFPDEAGFDAVTNYALSAFDGSDLFVNASWWNWDWGYNYERMTSAYAKYYDFILEKNYDVLTARNVKYHLPVTAGFNRGPANKNEDKGVASNGYTVDIWDQAVSTPEMFGNALRTAREQVKKYPNQTGRHVAICCWNEYSEGTVIEPTTYWEYRFLEQVLNVFNTEESRDGDEGPELRVGEKQMEAGKEGGKKEESTVVINPVIAESHEKFYFNVYPNPLRRFANIQFSVPEKTPASVQILSTTGQVVQELLNETVESGSYEVVWDASSKPTGFYFCRIITRDKVEVKKLILAH